VLDASGALVTPGLIDLHTHVYWGGTSLGIDADAVATRSGTTTFVDAGSAGAGNFLGFRRHVIERSRVRILAYLNISFAGIFGFSSSLMVGECENIRLCDPREAVPCGRDNSDIVVGIKVRTGRIAGGDSGVAPLDLALEAADALHLPVMAHMDLPPPSRSEVVPRLRRGDILTHCYRPYPNAALDGKGRVWDAILSARDRGVFFDLGHGMGSLDFDVAGRMIEDGFLPDAISSDVHLFCLEGPAFDNLVSMSKLISLGMRLTDVIAAATQQPAAIVGRPDLGTLSPGSVGDAAVLRLIPGEFPYADATGKTLVGKQRLVSEGIVFGGEWRPNDGPDRVPALEHYHPHRPTTHADAVRRIFGGGQR
jgi:dihydroorotase